MSNSVCFFAEGTPLPQPRPRFDSVRRRAYHGKGHARVKAWRAAVAAACRGAIQGTHELWTGPVALNLHYAMPRPKAHFVAGDRSRELSRKGRAAYWHLSKPDEDNMRKAIMDALTGVLWVDDSQVCVSFTEKRYHFQGEPAGARVIAELMQHDPDYGPVTR